MSSGSGVSIFIDAENLDVLGPSFDGDRETVVEQWLKRTQQILASLDFDE
jgi:hypothetical protein